MYNLMKRINKEAKKSESYNTGLIGEQLIIASYKQMSLDKLEKMMFIISKIIKQKKEFIKVANSQKGNVEITKDKIIKKKVKTNPEFLK